MTMFAPLEDPPGDAVSRVRRVELDLFSDEELLSLALGETRSRRDQGVARGLLAAHDGLRGVTRAGLGVLAHTMGERRAVRLLASIEIARRVACVALTRAQPYRSSRDVVRAVGPRIADLADEHVIVVLLDAKQRPIAERVIARGAAAECLVTTRQVFALAVREGATAVVLVHNHPSGDPTPSEQDLTFTRRLAEAGERLGLPVVDHVIIAREGSFSFLDAGLLAVVGDETQR